MELQILGAHQGESSEGRFTSLLIDGTIAIDAGGLTSTLSLEAQERVGDVLISHRHWDHIKDLPALGFNAAPRRQVRIHCTSEVKEVIESTILDDRIWLSLFRWPTPERPAFIFCPIDPGSTFKVGDYSIQPVPGAHTVPTLGFFIVGPGGESVLYTSDCGSGSGRVWSTVAPDLLITEVTYSNAAADLAERARHLCPAQLADELQYFHQSRGYYPRVLALHVNPFYEKQVAVELAEVAARLGAVIEMASEGYAITLGGNGVGGGHPR